MTPAELAAVLADQAEEAGALDLLAVEIRRRSSPHTTVQWCVAYEGEMLPRRIGTPTPPAEPPYEG